MTIFSEWLKIRESSAIKTPVPKKTQELSFSCGASALRSVLHYFGIEKTEKEVRKIAETNAEEGTRTKNLIRAARHFGLRTESKFGMSEKDLKGLLDEKKPVIVCFQAWGEKEDYDKDESGHYAVVIGYDEDNVYFQDPSIKGSRGHLSWKEFGRRWHDKDASEARRDQYGISFWRKKTSGKKIDLSKKSKKIT